LGTLRDILTKSNNLFSVPENEVLENGRFRNKFFKKENDAYVLKTPEEFELVIITFDVFISPLNRKIKLNYHHIKNTLSSKDLRI